MSWSRIENARKGPISFAIAAIIGAAITSVLQLLFLLRSGAPFDPPSFVVTVITGGIIGWGYRLATRLQNVSEEALDRLDGATSALDYQREPLKMLINDHKHPTTVRQLLNDSIQEGYRYISYVDPNAYLQYLISAIRESNKCEGVRHGPVRWFKPEDDDMGADDEMTQRYLNALRHKKMEDKTRIFLIDEADKEAMLEDLEDKKLMSYYWENSGTDVKTYWITTSDYNSTYRQQTNVPNVDFAIYDDRLLIQYDESTDTLFFDLIDEKHNQDVFLLFDRLREQIENENKRPFRRVYLPDEVVATSKSE